MKISLDNRRSVVKPWYKTTHMIFNKHISWLMRFIHGQRNFILHGPKHCCTLRIIHIQIYFFSLMVNGLNSCDFVVIFKWSIHISCWNHYLFHLIRVHMRKVIILASDTIYSLCIEWNWNCSCIQNSKLCIKLLKEEIQLFTLRTISFSD